MHENLIFSFLADSEEWKQLQSVSFDGGLVGEKLQAVCS